MKVRYNSPVILTFSLLAGGAFLLGVVIPASRSLFALAPGFSVASPVSWISLFTYTLGHAGAGHLAGNLAFILLVGPLVEEKYGSRITLAMMALTHLLHRPPASPLK